MRYTSKQKVMLFINNKTSDTTIFWLIEMGIILFLYYSTNEYKS